MEFCRSILLPLLAKTFSSLSSVSTFPNLWDKSSWGVRILVKDCTSIQIIWTRKKMFRLWWKVKKNSFGFTCKMFCCFVFRRQICIENVRNGSAQKDWRKIDTRTIPRLRIAWECKCRQWRLLGMLYQTRYSNDVVSIIAMNHILRILLKFQVNHQLGDGFVVVNYWKFISLLKIW